MTWWIKLSPDAISDLDVLYEFLRDAYLDQGGAADEATLRAEARISRIVADISRIARAPYRGTRRPDLHSALRNVTIDRATYYFAVDETAGIVTVSAIFFGGQDHINHMLGRMKVRKAD